jgi:hypothetical protein
MEKAFDRMEWNFLFAIMTKLGFDDKWINWLRICITSTSFSILLNGSSHGFFSPERGLRQGDPLSPFLFILGSEVLSRLFHYQESIGSLKGIRMSKNNSPISHLLFADDLIIFAKATSSEATVIKSCLDTYCSWSGQAINFSKSSILFSKNTEGSTINSIQGILPLKITSSASYYLGLPIVIGKSKREAFQPILSKLMGKLDGWRAKTLSQAGRTVLIKSVAAAIPTYTMSTYRLPILSAQPLTKCLKTFGGVSQKINPGI